MPRLTSYLILFRSFGRGEEHHQLSPTSMVMHEMAQPQTLKEKKSWTAFSVGRRKRRESLGIPMSYVQAVVTPTQSQTWSPRIRRSTEPGLTPSLTATSSPCLLTPPEPAHVHPQTAYLYSPSSMVSFSPATPNNLSPMMMMYPGIPDGTALPLINSENKAFQNTRLHTPETASPTMNSVAFPSDGFMPYNNRNSLSDSHLPLTTRRQSTSLGLRKMKSQAAMSILPTIAGSPAKTTRSNSTSGPLGGLGIHVDWSEMPSSTRLDKGKGRARDDSDLEAQASTLVRLAQAASSSTSPLRSEFGSLGQRPILGIKGKARGAGVYDENRNQSTLSGLTKVVTNQQSTLFRSETLVDTVDEDHWDGKGKEMEGHKAVQSPVSIGSDAGEAESEVYEVPLSDAVGMVLPAKLLFFMGFVFGPCEWRNSYRCEALTCYHSNTS